MKKNRGFTLIESVVVIAILGIMALAGTESILTFQKNALLDSTANEIASTLRTARTKSLAGELLADYPNAANYLSLPIYGAEFQVNSYFPIVSYLLDGTPMPVPTPTPEPNLPSGLSLSPTGQILFERVTGKPTDGSLDPPSVTLTRISDGDFRTIEISDQGVSVKK